MSYDPPTEHSTLYAIEALLERILGVLDGMNDNIERLIDVTKENRP